MVEVLYVDPLHTVGCTAARLRTRCEVRGVQAA